MSKMQGKSICKGRKAASIAVLPELYENQTVDNAANGTATHFTDESGFFAIIFQTRSITTPNHVADAMHLHFYIYYI